MEKTTQYMTLEECKQYRKVFEKYEPDTLRMAPSLPCSQLDLNANIAKRTKKELPFTRQKIIE